MSVMRSKWKSRSGASFATALGIFLICSIFATTIMSVANNLSASTRTQLADEQEYLSLSSAAKVFTEAVENCSVYRKQPATGAQSYITSKTFRSDMGESGTVISYDAVEKVLATKLKKPFPVGKLTVSAKLNNASIMNEVKIEIDFNAGDPDDPLDFTATLTVGADVARLKFLGHEEPAVTEKYVDNVMTARYTEIKWTLRSVEKGDI